MRPFEKECDENIDICLNCKRVNCPGECDAIKSFKNEDTYLIRCTFVAKNGNVHETYLTHCGDTLGTTANVKKARKYYMRNSAVVAVRKCKMSARATKYDFKIVKRSEELERLKKIGRAHV